MSKTEEILNYMIAAASEQHRTFNEAQFERLLALMQGKRLSSVFRLYRKIDFEL